MYILLQKCLYFWQSKAMNLYKVKLFLFKGDLKEIFFLICSVRQILVLYSVGDLSFWLRWSISVKVGLYNVRDGFSKGIPSLHNTVYRLDRKTFNYFLALVHSIPSWLVWAVIKMHGARCSSQTTHKPV